MPELVESDDKPEDYYGIDLDGVLSELGEFGKFQKIIYILTFLPVILDSCLCMSYIFTTAQVDYRYTCFIFITLNIYRRKNRYLPL